MVVPFSFYLRISFLLPADSIFASPSLDVAFALSDFPPSVHSSLLSIAPKQMCWCMNGTLSPNTSGLNSLQANLAALTWSTQRILSSLLSLKEGPLNYLHQPSTLEAVITIQNLYY